MQNLGVATPYTIHQENGWACIQPVAQYPEDLDKLGAALTECTSGITDATGVIIQVWQMNDSMLTCNNTVAFLSSDSSLLALHRIQCISGGYPEDHFLSMALKEKSSKILLESTEEWSSMPVFRQLSSIVCSAYISLCPAESDLEATFMLEISAISKSSLLKVLNKISSGLKESDYWVPAIDTTALNEPIMLPAKKKLTAEYLSQFKTVKEAMSDSKYSETTIRSAYKKFCLDVPSVQAMKPDERAKHRELLSSQMTFMLSYPAEFKGKAEEWLADENVPVVFKNLHRKAHKGRYEKLVAEVKRFFAHDSGTFRLKYVGEEGNLLLLDGGKQVQNAIEFAQRKKYQQLQVFVYPNAFYSQVRTSAAGGHQVGTSAAGGQQVGTVAVDPAGGRQVGTSAAGGQQVGTVAVDPAGGQPAAGGQQVGTVAVDPAGGRQVGTSAVDPAGGPQVGTANGLAGN